jgi:hypothetical protein
MHIDILRPLSPLFFILFNVLTHRTVRSESQRDAVILWVRASCNLVGSRSVFCSPEDRGNIFLRNVGTYVPEHNMQQHCLLLMSLINVKK